jgi:hypothetical protein
LGREVTAVAAIRLTPEEEHARIFVEVTRETLTRVRALLAAYPVFDLRADRFIAGPGRVAAASLARLTRSARALRILAFLARWAILGDAAAAGWG